MDKYIALSEVRKKLRKLGYKEVQPPRGRWHIFRKEHRVWPEVHHPVWSCPTDDQGNINRSFFNRSIRELEGKEE